MNHNQFVSFVLVLVIAGACKSGEENNEPPQTPSMTAVFATTETEPVQQSVNEDAADDPALWYNESNPSASLVLGSNKRMGLEVYDLTGKRLASYNTGRLNNIDVRYDFNLNGQIVDLVAGSNRSYDRIDIWTIDPTGTNFVLISDTNHRSQLNGVYGFCLYKSAITGETYAFVNDKTGAVEQWLLKAYANGGIDLVLERNLAARRQVEGMVADDETGLLYVGEEEGGILEFSAEAGDSTGFRRIDMSGEDNKDLRYDIEGLSLYYLPGGEGYLIASSQGNNRFAVFERKAPNTYLGYFEVIDSIVDGVKETDGIEVINMALGSDFPQGVFLCQDGFNDDEGVKKPQNFKLIPWPFIANSFDQRLSIDNTYRGVGK
jgi:3-phytase